MAAPIYRDEFEKRLEDLFMRSVEYTNSVLDVQRIKTVRQISQEISIDTDKKFGGQAALFQEAMTQQTMIFRDEIAQVRQEVTQVRHEVAQNQRLLQAIAKALNISNI